MDYDKRRMLQLIARMSSENETALTKATFTSCDNSASYFYTDKKIIFTEDVMYQIINAQLIALGTSDEKGFFIYGKEISPNLILFFRTTDNEFSNVVVSRTNISNKETYRKSTLLMGEDAIFEMLDNTLDRELPNKEKAIDSIIHFHVHPDLSINTSKFSIKDMFTYARVLPSINEELSVLGEKPINFYGALMRPDTKNRRILFSVVEVNADDIKNTSKFNVYDMPVYQLSNEGDMLEIVKNTDFFKYHVKYDAKDETVSYHITDYEYSCDITDTFRGQRILNEVKKYVKKTK